MSSCDNWESDSLGPFGIDYQRFYYCDLGNDGASSLLALLLLSCWVLYLIHILGSTASDYFSPTLGSICDNLQIPYDLAGVTLLAFGNGAPDVFSSITSFSGSADELVGLGALLGGSVFVATVVVGSIAYISPCRVTQHIFLRDISFHLLAATTVAIVATLGYVNFITSGFFFTLYLLYVSIVFALMWMSRSNDPEESDIPLTNMSSASIQTAFWHKTTKPNVTSQSNSRKTKTRNKLTYSSILHEDEDEDAELGLGLSLSSASKGYTFLILDNGNQNDSDDEGSPEDILSVNLMGSNISPVFDGTIIEDYFGDSKGNRDHIAYDSNWNRSESSSLTENLLSSRDRNHISNSIGVNSVGGDNVVISEDDDIATNEHELHIQRGSGKYSRILTALYWQQMVMKNHLHRNLLTSEWWEYAWWQKVLVLLEFPALIARLFTIPTTEEEQWNKYFAILQPIFGSIMFIFAASDVNASIHGVPVVVIAILSSLPMSLFVYLFTHFNRPPTSKSLVAVWNFWSFVMCIVWIYTIAKELVTCLSAMGVIFKVSPAFLGLTVLAWGNSIGDFFANTAVAKKGFGEMALAGCYGGPVFNILIGLGVSFLFAAFQSYPKAFPIALDTSSIISLVFLYIALLSTIAMVTWKKFHYDKTVGIYLISLYGVYTLCQFIALLAA